MAAPVPAPRAAPPPALARTSAPVPRSRRWLWLALKLGVTAGALAWAMSRTSFGGMSQALARLSAPALALSAALLLSNAAVGALRWRAVMHAYRGTRAPPLPFLARGYLVASFYNTFVPGNIGGDALRAHAVRAVFEHPADSFATIAIERGLGLAALLTLSGVGVCFLDAAPGWLGPLLVAGALASAVVAAGSPALLRVALAWIPDRLRSKIPAFSTPKASGELALAFLWSLVSQYLTVLSSHVLVRDLAPAVTALDSLAVVPLAMLSLYVPVSVAGLGVREAAFVVLFGRLGVSAADATGASLASMGTMMAAAVVGGVCHAFFPLALPPESEPPLDMPAAP